MSRWSWAGMSPSKSIKAAVWAVVSTTGGGFDTHTIASTHANFAGAEIPENCGARLVHLTLTLTLILILTLTCTRRVSGRDFDTLHASRCAQIITGDIHEVCAAAGCEI